MELIMDLSVVESVELELLEFKWDLFEGLLVVRIHKGVTEGTVKSLEDKGGKLLRDEDDWKDKGSKRDRWSLSKKEFSDEIWIGEP